MLRAHKEQPCGSDVHAGYARGVDATKLCPMRAQGSPGAVVLSPQQAALRIHGSCSDEVKLHFMPTQSSPGAVGFSPQQAALRISYLATEKLFFGICYAIRFMTRRALLRKLEE